MRIAIVGDPERKKTDAPLIERAHTVFEKALYVPINSIRFLAGKDFEAVYEREKLSTYDCVIPIPTKRYFDLFITLVYGLERKTFLPYNTNSLLAFEKGITPIGKLADLGFLTAHTFYTISNKTIQYCSINFPTTVSIGGKSMLVENKRSLKTISKLRKAGQAILVKEKIEEPEIQCLVMGNEVVACMERNGKKYKSTNVGSIIQEKILNVIKFMGSEYGSVSMKDNKITSISLSPDFQRFRKVTNKDITTPLLSGIRKRLEEERTVFDSLVDFMRRFI
jgi:hypothetical protein